MLKADGINIMNNNWGRICLRPDFRKAGLFYGRIISKAVIFVKAFFCIES
jgi:hypothetical protein